MSKDFHKAVISDEELEFEKLFGEATGAAGTGQHIERGDMVTGRIIKISGDAAFIDLGGKAEGIMASSELADLNLTVGEEVSATVVETGSEIRLSRRIANDAHAMEMLSDAFSMGLPVQGTIVSRNKGGFEVKVGSQRAFLPVSHLALENIAEEDLDAWIDQSHQFAIIECAPEARKLVVSRTALLRKAREAAAELLWAKLEVGQTCDGVVTSIQPYGAFVDLGGVDGLVHIAELSWDRIKDPSEVVAVGQEVSVTVKSLDLEKQRIGLSMKSADQDPWNLVGTTIKEGDVLDGEVMRLESFGAFVAVERGLEGLVHISEITHTRRVHHPRDVMTVGDTVRVAIKEIDIYKQRIGLSMKQVEGDPWTAADARFPIGAKVTGIVERVADFGVFVEVAPGVTALLPGSESGQPRGTDLARTFQKGREITATVLNVDVDARRMSLSLRAESDNSERLAVSQYQQQTRNETGKGGSLGTFADLFKGVKLK